LFASDQDNDLFSQAMGKVQPMAPSGKVAAAKTKPVVGNAASSGRARQANAPTIRGTATPRPAPRSAEEPWVLIADGVSRERLKRLAAGSPAVRQTFDLHGSRREEALSILASGIRDALAQGQRAVCIIHGRGLHSEGKAVLKEAVYHWLRDGAYAHAVLAAIPQPGSGGGACLVLLRRK
jgi:DNA-nicking Smr family endonuclease